MESRSDSVDNFNLLEKLCDDNYEYFKNDKSDYGKLLKNTFQQLSKYIKSAQWKIEKVKEFAYEYDFDENTPGNGYRSFIKIINVAIEQSICVCEKFTTIKYRYFLPLRKSLYLKEIIAYKDLLASLCTCLDYLFIMHEWSDNGSLFIRDNHAAEELFESGEKIDQYCFYGRCAGFQYIESMRSVMRGLSICMASYSQSYFSKANKIAKTTSSAWISSKYFWNPELKAKRIVNISHSAAIDFCKSFWFLAESEIMHTIPSIFGSSVEVNEVINIPPEPLQIENVETGELVNIPVPRSHIPTKSIPVRLLSSHRRDGMIGVLANRNHKPQPLSQYLLIHCHGGGFVAQSSKSHELYLRDWAIHLNAPIISIDYSLAPEAPYPRALEEVFYTYCWALKNANLLGTTAQKVVLAGDSAGANLCIAATFKCIDFGLRKPDGLFIAYCPVYIDFIPSPARMLCLMDPLLPFGFMIRCMKAYASIDETAIEVKVNDDLYEVSKTKEINAKNTSNESRNDETRRLSTISNTINDDESKTNRSIVSDATSDTFASASYHSQFAGNTDLLTPEIPSSCISLEDDSQPIMKLSAETLSNVSTPPIDSEDDKNITTAFLRECNSQNTITKTPSENKIVIDMNDEISSSKSLQERLQEVATNLVEMISSTFKSFTNPSEIESEHSVSFNSNENELTNLDMLIARNPGSEFSFRVPRDIYISPYIAPDEYLRQMPPTNILTSDMDPCLDDGVMFAKRLRNVGIKVKLDILEGLPHGFLNFTMVSKEANEASQKCAERIAELLNNKNDNF